MRTIEKLVGVATAKQLWKIADLCIAADRSVEVRLPLGKLEASNLISKLILESQQDTKVKTYKGVKP